MNNPNKGILIILSGPSAVGKGTICRELMRRYQDIEYSVSATTRKCRPGEMHGKEYFFYSTGEFQKLVQEGAFLEWAQVYDNYYGTPRDYVDQILEQGKDCILEIDIQGALQVKKSKPDGIFVFIQPPTKEELVRRITCRGTENAEEIGKRMSQVEAELAYIKYYDYTVVNDDVGLAVEKIRAIIIAERCRVKRICELENQEV